MHARACSRILLSPPPCLLPHTTGSASSPCPNPQVMIRGAPRAYATRSPFFLVKHVVSFRKIVFRKISRPPSRPKTQQERNRLQQSCHAPSYKLNSVPKLRNQNDYTAWRDGAVSILKTFNCWKIVEGIKSEPTKDDIKGDDTLLSTDSALVIDRPRPPSWRQSIHNGLPSPHYGC